MLYPLSYGGGADGACFSRLAVIGKVSVRQKPPADGTFLARRCQTAERVSALQRRRATCERIVLASIAAETEDLSVFRETATRSVV